MECAIKPTAVVSVYLLLHLCLSRRLRCFLCCIFLLLLMLLVAGCGVSSQNPSEAPGLAPHAPSDAQVLLVLPLLPHTTALARL